MKTFPILSLFFLAQILISCGFDSGEKSDKKVKFNYLDRKFSGEINGEKTEFIDGYARVEENGKLNVTLTSERLVAPCQPAVGLKPKVFFTVDRKEKETALNTVLNSSAWTTATVVTYEKPTIPNNFIITAGKISIDKISANSVSGKGVMHFSGKVYLNGTFNVNLCPEFKFDLPEVNLPNIDDTVKKFDLTQGLNEEDAQTLMGSYLFGVDDQVAVVIPRSIPNKSGRYQLEVYNVDPNTAKIGFSFIAKDSVLRLEKDSETKLLMGTHVLRRTKASVETSTTIPALMAGYKKFAENIVDFERFTNIERFTLELQLDGVIDNDALKDFNEKISDILQAPETFLENLNKAKVVTVIIAPNAKNAGLVNRKFILAVKE